MYISNQGLQAMQKQHIRECLDRAELERKMPLEQDRTAPGASPIRRVELTLSSLTDMFRRIVARV